MLTERVQIVMRSTDVGATDYPETQRVSFSNSDIEYLTRCNEVEPRFIGRMLRIFGEAVVLESLRRFRKDWTEPVFVGICRKVERETT